MKKNTSVIAYILLFLFLISLDQISKHIVRIKGGFYICNQGIAFGIKFTSFIAALASIAILSFVLISLRKSKLQNSNFKSILNFQNKKKNIFGILGLTWNNLYFGLWILFAGAISNIIDRIFFGCVIDFIDLKFWPASNAVAIAGWPIFNLADIYITIGVIILITQHIAYDIKQKST